MFKVLCVDNSEMRHQLMHKIEVGEVVTVVRQMAHNHFEKGPIIIYLLKEYPVGTDGHPCMYWEGHFAPIDGADEKEMEEERQRDFAERLDKVRKAIERYINKMPA